MDEFDATERRRIRFQVENQNELLTEDYRNDDISTCDNVVKGICTDMCPESERQLRETQLDLSRWEIVPGTENMPMPRTNASLAVKKYKRSAAGNEAPTPKDLRTPETLEFTLEYLVKRILDSCQSRSTLIEAQKFVRDRTRSIRQDLTIQHISDNFAIRLNEAIARFHIFIQFLLFEEVDQADFDPFQNMEQLRKVLLTLVRLYDNGLKSINEGEIRACYLLVHYDNIEILIEAHNYLMFSEVLNVVQIIKWFKQENISLLVDAIHKSSLLISCLADFMIGKLIGKTSASLDILCQPNLFSEILDLKSLITSTNNATNFYPSLNQAINLLNVCVYKSGLTRIKIDSKTWSELIFCHSHKLESSSRIGNSLAVENGTAVKPPSRENVVKRVKEISTRYLNCYASYLISFYSLKVSELVWSKTIICKHEKRKLHLINTSRNLMDRIKVEVLRDVSNDAVHWLWLAREEKEKEKRYGFINALCKRVVNLLLDVMAADLAQYTLYEKASKRTFLLVFLKFWRNRLKKLRLKFLSELVEILQNLSMHVNLKRFSILLVGGWNQFAHFFNQYHSSDNTRRWVIRDNDSTIDFSWVDDLSNVEKGCDAVCILTTSSISTKVFQLTKSFKHQYFHYNMYLHRFIFENVVELNLLNRWHHYIFLQPTNKESEFNNYVFIALEALLYPIEEPFKDHPLVSEGLERLDTDSERFGTSNNSFISSIENRTFFVLKCKLEFVESTILRRHLSGVPCSLIFCQESINDLKHFDRLIDSLKSEVVL